MIEVQNNLDESKIFFWFIVNANKRSLSVLKTFNTESIFKNLEEVIQVKMIYFFYTGKLGVSFSCFYSDNIEIVIKYLKKQFFYPLSYWQKPRPHVIRMRFRKSFYLNVHYNVYIFISEIEAIPCYS